MSLCAATSWSSQYGVQSGGSIIIIINIIHSNIGYLQISDMGEFSNFFFNLIGSPLPEFYH